MNKGCPQTFIIVFRMNKSQQSFDIGMLIGPHYPVYLSLIGQGKISILVEMFLLYWQ